MDPVHERGPWTRSTEGVHGPGVHVLYFTQDDLVSVLNENADTFDSESPPKHLPFGCQKKLEQLSEEIELLKQENRHYANQLQAIHDFSETKPYDRFRTSKENNCDVRRA